MTPIELLMDVIKQHAPEDIWQGSALAGYRLLGNTNRGEIGEEFIRQYLRRNDIEASHGIRTSPTDMNVFGKGFEIKTASLGANGTFQFNHIRLDRQYDYLLCLGICPDRIVFNMWRKGEVAEGQAGKLVRMAEGQSITFKLTKKVDTMVDIEGLPASISAIK
ncbi:hypothetical protein [Roseibium sediminis]|uniref:hypothetical protein n=1 Tax=Roseibium sediminis TaxID=1775174 RepID=UPI00123CB1D1|nr:hypothetical protein [Roseibium sediminis]